MKEPDNDKTKEQLIKELRELRSQNAKLIGKISDDLIDNEENISCSERIELVLESGNEGFWELIPDKKLLILSKSHYEFLEYNFSDIKLNYYSWIDLIHPEDIYKVKKQIIHVFRNKLVNCIFEYRIRLKSGNYKCLHARGKVVKWNADGYPQRIIGIHTDITTQKKVEKSLRKSEQFFSSIFENAGIGMTILDTNFHLLKMNKAFCKISEYSEEELKNMSYFNLISTKDIAVVKKIIKNLLSGKISKYQTDRSYIKKNGSVIWVNITVTAVYDEKQNPEFVIGMGEDITEKKHQEKIQTLIHNITNAINTTNDLFEFFKVIKTNISNFIESKDFFIALYDKANNIFNVPDIENNNREYYSFPCTGSIESLVLSNKEALLLNEDKINELIDNKTLKNLNIIPKQWLGVPLFADNIIVGVLGVQLFDNKKIFTKNDKEILGFISNQIGLLIQKKQSEDALKIERAHFKELFDSSPEAIALIDNNGIILNINNEFTALFGYAKKEAVGKSIDNLIVLDSHKEEADLYKVTVINGKYIKEDTKRKRKDNTVVDVSVLGAPIKVENGQIGIYIIYRDNSKKKKIEKKLLEAKEKAEESDLLKTSFLTNMSHEIRTPMNAILGFSELMTDEYLSANERREFVREIKNSSNSLLKLIENIIDISKIESKQIILKKENISLDKFLADIYKKFNSEKSIVGKDNISLRLSKNNFLNNAFINSDRLRLNQIFNHIINNSLKYTEKGSIEFGYSVNENGLPEFFVKDSGIGIRKNRQKIIFEHFRKIEDDNTRLYRGTGIGLTITKKLVNLLGGEIWVDSEINKGSKFYFTISDEVFLKKKNHEKEKFNKIKKIYNWEKVNILIAEDEYSNIRVLKAMLSKTNAKLVVVKNGQEAVDYCKNNIVDIILMDIKMPVLNGIEATKLIKSKNPEIKIIIQTAYLYDNEKQDCIDAGSSDFIYKPTSVTELLQTIAKYIK